MLVIEKKDIILNEKGEFCIYNATEVANMIGLKTEASVNRKRNHGELRTVKAKGLSLGRGNFFTSTMVDEFLEYEEGKKQQVKDIYHAK
tara:strand:+ start:3523 stop:3789 length:267 start_codon:yes stop_codon:yes gene_type:complete